MPIIEVNHVTKEFQLGQLRSLKETALDAFARLRGKPVSRSMPFKALDDVDFQVESGEVIGIIGQNGAGKSTLLKMLAGISGPTRGNVVVRGNVAPLIEVGAGLVPELTGRENTFLNAFILGMSRAEIAQKFDDIIAFAELEDFVDTPVKRYSSGMRVRLGFAIATAVEADILIIDEVLSVGDLAFQRKCFDRMEEMIKRKGRTVLIVSHNIRHIERICTRAILLEHGRILEAGRPVDVCNRYYDESDKRIRKQGGTARGGRGMRLANSGEVELESISILDDEGKETTTVQYGSDITIQVAYRVHAELVNAIFGVGIHTTDLLYLADKTTEEDAVIEPSVSPGSYVLKCRIKKFPLLPGVYSLRLRILVGEICRMAFYAEALHPFHVRGGHVRRPEGFVALDTSWNLSPAAANEFSNASVTVREAAERSITLEGAAESESIGAPGPDR
jgi:ABC-type polysaccharide/polyol phosphate transport system ATPase subunit